MKAIVKSIVLALGFPAVVAFAQPAQAQDIVAYWQELCERGGGYLDEDRNCLEPIEAEGGETTIDLIPLEELILSRMQAPGSRLRSRTVQWSPEQTLQVDGGLQSSPYQHEIYSQQEALQICFEQLERDINNCSVAFANDVKRHNICIAYAGVAHEGCVAWVQKLPYATTNN